MKTITLALKTDGTAALVHGPEVPIRVQRATVHEARHSGIQDGVECLEVWERKVIKRAVHTEAKASRKLRAALEHKAAAAKPAKPAKAKKPTKAEQKAADEADAALAAKAAGANPE